MFVERIKKAFLPGQPIFISDILSIFPEFTRAYIFRLINSAEINGDLIRFSRGVYCIPKKTFFGYSTTTSSAVATSKYLTDSKTVYGIYSGLTLLNQFAISTQIPNVLEIITNNESTRKRTVEIDGMRFVVRKSRFEITSDNYSYYTILQLFSELDSDFKLDKFSKQRIKEYIVSNNINQNQLIKYAMSFPAQALKNLLGSEVLNGTL